MAEASGASSLPDATARPGLRERKKARTRADIQAHTLRLIEEQGYAATTVEQIADAAEISPSTFFRYFRNKEEAAVADFMDEAVFEAAIAAPADLDPIQALGLGIRTVLEAMTDDDWRRELRRGRLIQTVPELQRGLMEEMTRPLALSIRAVAVRLDIPADSLEARMFGSALVGGLLGLMAPGHHGETTDVPADREQALAVLEEGLALLATMLTPPAV